MIVEIDRGDLSALVELLAHEAFSCNTRGEAARRACRQLERAISTNASAIALSPAAAAAGNNGGDPHGEHAANT